MQVDAIVIGAGLSGLYQLYRLRQLGLSVKVVEAAPEAGGTWYRNRYPGCRFDSESYTYGYSFSRELLEDWDWSELFAGQPEVFRYIQHVVERFDLRRDIVFDAAVARATYDADAAGWTVETADGRVLRCRFLITAIGVLSDPIVPAIPGQDDFAGESFHTYRWPDGLDLTGKRVAVIGTGATGIQVIQTIAPIVGQMTVYQRNGNWSKPLRNRAIGAEEMARIKADYADIFARCRVTGAGFIHDMHRQNTFDAPDEERRRFYERKYAEPGFAFLLGGYQDLPVDEAASREAQAFLAEKVRERVADPRVADLLIPKDHPLGAKRMPMESGYYEAYNRDNVELVDLLTTPIECITAGGIVSDGIERPFDVIVYATGFDAYRGAFDRIEIRGVGGRTLLDDWREGVRSYLGFQTHGFPNLLMILGPLSGGGICNIPRCIEQNVEFITDLLAHMTKNGFTRIEAEQEAEDEWGRSAEELAAQMVVMKYDSYANSANARAPRVARRQLLIHPCGQNRFREICADIAADDYPGFRFDR